MHDSSRATLLDAVARAVVDEHRDCASALRRSAQSLDLRMPISGLTQDELYAAVASYRRIFQPEQLAQLERGRELALEAMRALARFSPRLFGGLVHGGDRIDRISLFLRAETPEDVLFRLDDLGIPWRSAEATLDYGRGRSRVVPNIRFLAGQTAVHLLILPETGRGERPLDPVDGRPWQTLTEAALTQLLEDRGR